MEVREIAACGIAQRVFSLELEEEDLAPIYRILRYAHQGVGFYDPDFLEDLKSQMAHIVGPAVEKEPGEDVTGEDVHWREGQGAYYLNFGEAEAPKLYQVFSAVSHPGEGYDRELAQRLLDQAMEMAPSLLSNLPVINR